ncbi:MAG: GAF domain-containing sensor histidine kinase, partial [Candidatus Thorarchaeota archaeon]
RIAIGLGYCRRCSLCRKAASVRSALVIHPLPPECPLYPSARIIGHAIVPLLVKERAVGLLNLVFGPKDLPQTADLDLLTDLGRQLGVAIENARLWAELQDREALKGQLLRKIILAQEQERQRIARDLHDQAGQALTSLLVGLRAMEKASDLTQAQALAQELKGVVTQALDELHDMALELRPSVLDDLGLVPALARYVASCPTRFGLQADFEAIGLDGQRLPPEVETTLYRITQEALTNVARHADASHASVLLQRRGSALVLVVDDDGVGFDVARVMDHPSEHDRLGLYGIEERASLVDGHLTIESSPDVGTTITVEIPMRGVWLTHEPPKRTEQAPRSAS